jgi:hypothetical protein
MSRLLGIAYHDFSYEHALRQFHDQCTKPGTEDRRLLAGKRLCCFHTEEPDTGRHLIDSGTCREAFNIGPERGSSRGMVPEHKLKSE